MKGTWRIFGKIEDFPDLLNSEYLLLDSKPGTGSLAKESEAEFFRAGSQAEK